MRKIIQNETDNSYQKFISNCDRVLKCVRHYKVRQVLQSVTGYYYKVHQVLKMWQAVITKCVKYYKVWQLLQSDT